MLVSLSELQAKTLKWWLEAKTCTCLSVVTAINVRLTWTKTMPSLVTPQRLMSKWNLTRNLKLRPLSLTQQPSQVYHHTIHLLSNLELKLLIASWPSSTKMVISLSDRDERLPIAYSEAQVRQIQDITSTLRVPQIKWMSVYFEGHQKKVELRRNSASKQILLNFKFKSVENGQTIVKTEQIYL